MSDITNLKTTVRNISGAKRTFGYLPHNGKTLRSNEEYSFFGNIFEMLAAKNNKRDINALATDLLAGNLVVTSTPSQHYYDPVGDTVQVLKINNGVLVQDDPSWGHYVSSGVIDGDN